MIITCKQKRKDFYDDIDNLGGKKKQYSFRGGPTVLLHENRRHKAGGALQRTKTAQRKANKENQEKNQY